MLDPGLCSTQFLRNPDWILGLAYIKITAGLNSGILDLSNPRKFIGSD